MEKETIEIQKELFDQRKSKLEKYQELIVGRKGFSGLIKYEFIMTLVSWIPGALGLLLRGKMYPLLFGRVGKNVSFGTNVVLRHPHKITIGDNVVVDDNCVLDAKGRDNKGIFIGDGVFLGRNTILNCKNGDIIIEDNVSVGFNCMIFSASEVRVGADYLIAAYTYLVGGTHHFDDPAIPVLHQGRSSQGIRLEPGGWLGAHVTVFDGVHIGENVVIGAGSSVNRDVPDYAIAAGSPVRVIKQREVPVEEPRSRKKVTVAVINFNGEEVLEDTLGSVFRLDYPAVEEIFLVDNCSTDNSVKLVQEKFPDVRILQMESNLGVCTARNKAIRTANSDLIFLIDNDVVLSPDALLHLEDGFDSNPQAGIVSAQIRFFDNPEKIQYNGAHIHFAGGAIQNRLDLDKPVVVGAVPGTAVLVDRHKAIEIGLFDEDYFFGWEDGDFSFRMTIAGYPVLVVSRAKAFHKKTKRGFRWVDYQVRNRWWFILKTYNFRTLLVALPGIFFYQIAIMGFLTLKGQLWRFLRGTCQVVGSLPVIVRKRKEVMKHKKIRDRQVLFGKNIDLMGDVKGGGLIKMITSTINLLLSVYWMFAKWLVR